MGWVLERRQSLTPRGEVVLGTSMGEVCSRRICSRRGVERRGFFIHPAHREGVGGKGLFSINVKLSLPFYVVVLMLLVVNVVVVFSTDCTCTCCGRNSDCCCLMERLVFTIVNMNVVFILSFFGCGGLRGITPIVLTVSCLYLLIILMLPNSRNMGE